MRRLCTILAAVSCLVGGGLVGGGLVGCQPSETLELVLVHEAVLDPGRDFTSGRVRIIDVGDPAAGQPPFIAVEHRAPMASFLEGFPLEALRDLVAGHTYVALLSFDVPSACDGAVQVVGRTLPFVHEDASYEVTAQIGCADRFRPTRGAPRTPRIGFDMQPTPTGELIVAGGARTLELMPFGYRDAVLEVERYDVRTGQFDDVGALTQARIAPAMVALADGEIGVIGGLVPEPILDCAGSTEIVWPAPRAGADLAVARCMPTAARLENGEVMVTGGEITGMPTLEVLDTTLDVALRRGEPGSSTLRQAPTVIPVGTAAFTIGGEGFGGSRVEVSNPYCATTGTPCSLPITIASSDDPGPGWTQMNAGLAYCFEGAEVTTGALYVMGGATRAAPDEDARGPVDSVLCGSLSGDLTAWTLSRVGALPAARAGAQLVRVDTGDGRQRFLVIGGREPASEAIYEDALLVEVRGCTCDVVSITSIPMPPGPSLVFQQARALADGSILVVGGARGNLGLASLDASAYSALFIPDTESD